MLGLAAHLQPLTDNCNTSGLLRRELQSTGMSLVLILVIYLCAEISDTSKTWDSKTFGVLIRRNMDRDHGVGSCFVSLVCHYADCCYWYSYFLI